MAFTSGFPFRRKISTFVKTINLIEIRMVSQIVSSGIQYSHQTYSTSGMFQGQLYFAKKHMPQMSYQEVHLPLSPTQTPYLSLSRNSTYNAFINRKLQSRAPLYHDPSEEEHPHQSFWTRNVTYYSSISKDDMLRVLKGKNYRLSTSSNLKVSAANISIKDTRTILKSMTVNTESNCLRRMKRQKEGRSLRNTLKKRDDERIQNQKKYLVKNLRLQKWLQPSRWQVI